EMKDDLYTMHLVAAHTFSKIRIEGDFMYVAMLDPDRLRDAVKDGKFKIAYEVVENGIVLTAPTEDLQKFFLKYGEEETAYRKPRKLRRKLKDSASPDSVEATAPEKPAPGFTTNQETPKKEPDAVSPFEFHSGFWVNLHHFLYQQARLSPEQSTYAYKLTPQQRKVWESAVDYYKNGPAKLDLLFDDEMVSINNRLSDLESSPDLKGSGLKPDLIAALERAAPVYRAYW